MNTQWYFCTLQSQLAEAEIKFPDITAEDVGVLLVQRAQTAQDLLYSFASFVNAFRAAWATWFGFTIYLYSVFANALLLLRAQGFWFWH